MNQILSFLARLLRMFFPTLVKEEAYEFLYSKVGQYISVGNFWNDPHHHSLYLKYNKFLPVINNEALNSSSDRKMGITKLKKLVLIGGPDDEIIEPWQSRYSIFFKLNFLWNLLLLSLIENYFFQSFRLLQQEWNGNTFAATNHIRARYLGLEEVGWKRTSVYVLCKWCTPSFLAS